MKISEQIQIKARPEVVWKLIEDPAQICLWNPKLIQVVPVSSGQRRVGYCYRATYEMSGKRSEMSFEIREYEPFRKWSAHGNTIKSEAVIKIQNSGVIESYELIEKGEGTLVKQEIDMDMSYQPFWLRILVWIILKTGKPVGSGPLDKLKQLVEGEK